MRLATVPPGSVVTSLRQAERSRQGTGHAWPGRGGRGRTLCGMAGHHFRAGIVAIVRRSDGQVLAFERADVPGQWQLPAGRPRAGRGRRGRGLARAGGGDRSRPEAGRARAGPRRVDRDGVAGRVWSGSSGRLGQAQRWFEFRPHDDGVTPRPDGREFRDWKWVEPAWLVEHVVAFKRPAYARMLTAAPRSSARRARPAVADDLFSAVAEDRLRAQAPLAARLRPRTIDDVVGQAQLLGPGPPAAPPRRAGPPVVGAAVGPARHRQDDARPRRRRHDVAGVRAAVGGHGRRQGRPRGDRAGRASASASAGRARSCSSTRSTASRSRSRTPCCRRSRTARSC